MWNTLLYQPLVNLLIFLYQFLGNFGWAVIVMTVLIKLALLPLTLPSLKTAKKMKLLAPDLEKLKEKYKDDKQKLLQAQMDLYRSAGVKPMAGLIPQIVQIVILIALFQAFRQVIAGSDSLDKLNDLLYSGLKFSQGAKIRLDFWYLELTRPDTINVSGKNLPGFFLILSAVAQFLSAKLMMPVAKKQTEIAKNTPEKKDDFSSALQVQSLYVFPAMTIFIGLSFPSAITLYWFVFSVIGLIQQFIMEGQWKKK